MSSSDTTSRVNVFCRLRPFGERENSGFHAVRADEATGKVTVEDTEGAVENALRASFSSAKEASSFDGGARVCGSKSFEFDGVFDTNSTQAEVLNRVGLPVLNAVLQGYHGCIFAYGQTGSGKTFCLLNSGSSHDGHQEAGLLPRLVATLFVRARIDAAHVYAVEAGSFQVYNEQVDDLLHPQHREGVGHNLSVSRTAAGQGVVDDLTWIGCSSAKQLLELFAKARKNVVYAETKMNKASSRSHACFQLRVSRRPRGGNGNAGKGTVATLSVVDLAGSERVKRSGVQGKELKEAVNINGSLLALGNVVSALATGKKHVPYRDSKLTRLLEGRVGGNCRTNLLVCCSPSADSVSETVSTLSFAQRAMCVKVAATINEVDDVLLDDSLAVVPTSDDAAKSEALRKRSEAETAAALESRRLAEDALRRERRAKETAIASERRAAATAAESVRRETEAKLESERKISAEKLRESSIEVEKSNALVEEHKLQLVELKVAAAELDADNKNIKKNLQVAARELAAAHKTIERERDLLSQEEKRLSQVKNELSDAQRNNDELRKKNLDLSTESQKRAEEASAAQSKIVALDQHMREMEAAALETQLELRDTRQALVDLQQKFDATAKHSVAELDEERRVAALHQQRLSEELRHARDTNSSLAERSKTLELERDQVVEELEKSHCAVVAQTLAAAAMMSAQRDLAEMDHANQLLSASQQAESDRKKFEEARADFEAAVEARNMEIQQVSTRLRQANDTLEAERRDHAEKLALEKREKEKQVEKHEQLEQQLQALEERAMSELQKAESAREAAAKEHEALAASAADLEKKLDDEARANENLAAEIARVREDSVNASIRYQEDLRVERERGSEVAAELEALVKRFESREPRSQDLDAIDKLRGSVQAERQRAKDLMNAALQTQRELEHERQVDRIFGPESAKYRKERDRYRRMDNEQHRKRPASTRRRPSQQIHIKSTSRFSNNATTIQHSKDV